MLQASIILNVVLSLSLLYVIFIHSDIIKDEDKNFLPDTLEDKAKKMKADLKEMKTRLADEIDDVGEAIKEVGDQLDDIPKAISGKKRAGRKTKK